MPFFVNLVKSVLPTVPSLKSVIDVDPFEDTVAPDTHSFFEMTKSSAAGVEFFTSSKVDTNNDIAILPFSSGTTGKPKAVMLTHTGLCSNALQYLQPGIGLRETPERYIGLLPFYHCFGFCALALMPMRTGSHVCTLPNFDPLSFVAAIKNHKPTVLNVVTPLVQFIVAFPELGKKEFESVHTVVSGAAPVGPLLTQALLKKADNDLFFQEGYGMTEATCFTHISRERWKNTKLGSIGCVIPGTKCKVVDIDTGEALPQGKAGELWIKGPQLMKGYYKNETATRDTITPDGWLKTGDVAKYDEDLCFYIVDRIKELIKVKGLQVSPSELEDLLRTHPDIADVAVVGVNHERFGEAPRAYVVKKNDSLTATKVHDFLDKKVAPHKKLAGGVEFIDAIPRAPSGKILRRVLLANYLSGKH
ncbi:4-coumarate--CoA ligase 1 [Folsomia candida]|nr:4-coumarate--CoA ligase 1 [Folsomia candida]